MADLLKLNQQTVRNWIDAGELPAVRVGSRRVRIKRSDLGRFIERSSPAQDKPGGADAEAFWSGSSPGPAARAIRNFGSSSTQRQPA